ncbi:serine/threonine protein kinase [Derxia gummosa]|uniref:Stress response kinase A n=1 Tax=Derxia gummosa DSM 723 TaxID=1121388 RepID=A0A8B6X3N3_9BURK|nr:serine/threonine protein kinase [Derxia gummosa]
MIDHSPDTAAAPYAGFTPEQVLDALDALGFLTDGRLLALNSYENRVFQVGIEDAAPVVVKVYRPGRWTDAQIAEEHAFVTELAAREIPVAAPLPLARADSACIDLAVDACGTLATVRGHRYAVFPRCVGRAPELDRSDTLEWMGRFLGRIHAVGAMARFATRPAVDLDSYGRVPRDWLLAHADIPTGLRDAWSSTVGHALDRVAACFDRAGDVATLRLHGDCHAGNVLWNDRGDPPGPCFVDFDDARSGPAVQDLWMLLSGDRASMSAQFCDVLAGYEDFMEFDRRELHLIEALRTLRLIHYSAWLAQRWSDPAFPAAFPWFGSEKYWQDRILELREQIALMDEAPLVV